MTRPGPGPALLMLGLAGAIAGCFYAPTFEEGQFTCRRGDCPAGFECTGAPAFECRRTPGPDPDLGADSPPTPTDLGDATPPPDNTGPCAADSLEPNDDQVNARAIGEGSNLPLGVGPGMATLCPGDQDWFKLEIAAGGVLLALEADDVAGLVLELRNASGEVVATGMPQGRSALVVSSATLSGTHFVRVSGVAPNSGTPYGLVLQTPPNDLCEGAVPLAAGDVAIADFTSADHDYDPGDGGCTGVAENGADLAYLIELDQPGRVVVHPDGNSPVDGSQAAYAMFLVRGSASACQSPGSSCVGGARNVVAGESGSFLRTADPVIDQELEAGRYYLVVSYQGSDNADGTLVPVAVTYDRADCVTRQDCDVTVPSYCGSTYTCASPTPASGGSAFVEAPGPGVVSPPVTLPDAVGDGAGGSTPATLRVPLTVSSFGASDRVAEVKVGVTLRHPWRGDLSLTLISPPDPQNGSQSRRVTLFRAQPGDSVNDVVELFGVTTPTVESLDALGDATNAPANGMWQLEVTDASFLDQGELLDFRLFLRKR